MNRLPFVSPYLSLLQDRINLHDVPFTERGSRLVVFRDGNTFNIRLAERWLKRDPDLGAYLKRPPILEELQFTDENGSILDLSLTTYPHQLICHTPVGEFGLAFVDTETIAVMLPAAGCGLSFLARVERAESDRRGGVLRVTGDIRRSIAFTTNAEVVQNVLDPYDGQRYRVRLLLQPRSDTGTQPVVLFNITPRLGFNRYVVDLASVVEARARRWHSWFAAAPPVAEPYQAQYYFAWWVMGAGLISPRYYVTREAMTPSKISYVGVWQWDAYFHALAYRHVDMRLAQDQLRLQLDHQTPEGMLPDAIHDEGTVTRLSYPVDADVTKPPLIAWAAWKLHQHAPDVEFLNEIYEPLVRWNRWWFERNDVDGNGLCEYQHPYSSGLDDNPLWDDGMPVEAPDLNTYLYLQQEALAGIAGEINAFDEARYWSGRAAGMIERMLTYSWDAEAGLFWARRSSQPVRVRTPFNLFPLITGQLTADINARLVAHLKDPQQFWAPFPVPTVALNDAKYETEKMWRGPTWVNVNYLLIEGLMRTGYVGLARELRQRTLALMNRHNNIYEYYNSLTGENPPKAASMFGWSAALFIDLAIQATGELD